MRLIAVVLAAVVSASCWAGDDSIVFDSATSEVEEGAHRFGATTDGVMTWWIVRRADVANTPDWSAGGDPPLSLPKALQLATAHVSKYTTTPEAFRLDKVELLTFGANCCMDPVRKWIYVVTFEREYTYGGRRFDTRGTLTIPVLLDGRVIEGVKE